MKLLTLWALPHARYIAYGEDANHAREIMLGATEEPSYPFVIAPQTLEVFISTAIRKGWRLDIRMEVTRRHQAIDEFTEWVINHPYPSDDAP